jgi:hypothetical protein
MAGFEVITEVISNWRQGRVSSRNLLVTTILVFDVLAAIMGLAGFLLIGEWLVVVSAW